MTTGTLRLLTDDEVVATYGDPTKFMSAGGKASIAWDSLILDLVQFPEAIPLSWKRPDGASIYVRHTHAHKLVAAELQQILHDIHGAGLWPALHDFGGCYEWRRNANNPAKLSRHSWAIAVDVNVANNPNRAQPNMDAGIVTAFAARGWLWGGDRRHFPTPDGMHFEKGTGTD